MTTADRRATPRLEVLDHLHGQLVSLDIPLIMRDVSAGGFSIGSGVSFPAGARHRFLFTTNANVEVVIEATAVHSWPTTPVSGLAQYVTGFAFVHDSDTESWRAVDTLLNAMIAVLHPE